MLQRTLFIAITAFWILMNGLLWHYEFGGGNKLVSSVPPRTVFEKIITAPDDSTLALLVDGVKVGYLRLRPRVEEPGAAGLIVSESEPEGMVGKITGYVAELEGSFLVEQLERTIKLRGDLRLNPRMEWEHFRVEASARPVVWEIKGRAAERDLWINAADGEVEWIRRITFEQLSNPFALLRELDMPLPLMPLGGLGGEAGAGPALALRWEARFDWLRIGSSRLRVYRLEGRLTDGLKMVVLVSRVGEILRVEMPGGVKMLNDALFAI